MSRRLLARALEYLNPRADLSRYVPLAQHYLPEHAHPMARRMGGVRGLPLVLGLALLALLGLLSLAYDGAGPAGARDRDTFSLLGPLDPRPLRDLCAHRRFQEGLYFECLENSGDVSEVRNGVLHCTRYAVELGAALVMPKVRTRATTLDPATSNLVVGLDYLFDEAAFRENLALVCPNLPVYERLEDVPDADDLRRLRDDLDPREFHKDQGTLNRNIWTMRPLLADWMFEGTRARPTLDTPILVNLKRTVHQWPGWEDDYAFWLEFGKILPFDTRAYRLARVGLRSLARMTGKVTRDERALLGQDLHFVGQHVTGDQFGIGTPKDDLADQLKEALVGCLEARIAHLYIATGSIDQAASAVVASEPLGITAISKWGLFGGSDLAELESMTYDQQSVVDYLILLRSTKFFGYSDAPFSNSIAIARYAATSNLTSWDNYVDGASHLRLPPDQEFPWSNLNQGEWP